MNLRSVIVLGLLLSGCAPSVWLQSNFRWPDNSLLVAADRELSADRRQAIEAAIDYWNDTLELTIFLSPSYIESPEVIPGIVIVEKEPVLYPGRITSCGVTNIKHGLGVARSAVITIRKDCADKLPPPTLESLLRHELGHALGLKHSDFEEDVMYFSMKGVRHPKPASKRAIEQLKKRYR